MIPKKIFSLWVSDQSDDIPETVQVSTRRWRELNPEYEFILIRGGDLADFNDVLPVLADQTTVQAYSDILRIHLLSTHGGVWVDAATCPVRPLREWLDDAGQPSGFFAFDSPGPDRPLASWFIASSPGHYLASRWCAEVDKFWRAPRPADWNPRDQRSKGGRSKTDLLESMDGGPFPYFWFHYLFGYLVDTDPEFSAHWAACTKISARPPHRLQALCRSNAPVTRREAEEALKGTLVQKLDWRSEYPWRMIEDILSTG